MSTSDSNKNGSSWDDEIIPVKSWLKINFREIYNFRDLIFLFVKRDFVVFYKQTILGPLWYIIQPVFNTLVFAFVFGTIAEISTDGMPPFLFYLSGTVIWGYFANSFSQTSQVFVSNKEIFGKVYFPRITVPISIVATSVIQFFIQFLIFVSLFTYYKFQGLEIYVTIKVLFLPVILFQIALLSVGIGMLFSALTAKYRDLIQALSFLVQLWMYLTPVVYPLSEVPEKFRFFIALNPMTAPVESFREIFLGVSSITSFEILVSWIITIIFFFLGLIFFTRVEKTFMDTV
jgi:lipopolysaccharide transport system permease protein